MVTSKKTILLTEPDGFPEIGAKLLDEIGVVEKGPFSRADLIKKINKTEILFVRLSHHIDREILEKAENLKVIVTATTGLNHIDVDFAKSKGIEVLSLRGETEFLETISPTADLTFGLILSLVRNIPSSVSHVLGGGWNRDLFKGRDLMGKTLGIYGYGRIGRKVARMALAFDMKVLAYDIDKERISDGGVESVSEDMLLKNSDIVSLHVLHTTETDKIFGEKQFSFMKQGAYFVNTARGELVDETALLNALESRHLTGAALDVLSNEQDFLQSPLIAYAKSHNNLLITPHIGGASVDSMERVENFMVGKLQKWVRGDRA